MTRWKLSAASALSTLLVACRAEERVSHDLVELFPTATLVQETAFLDFGSEAGRDRLRAGFSANEIGGDGTSFVWSEGGASEIRLFVSEPRPLSLAIRCWPFAFPGAPRQTISLSLNDEAFADVELLPEAGEYRVGLPAARLLSGENLLRVSYGYTRSPSDVFPHSLDARRLAVGWDWLRVEGAFSTQAPSAKGAGDDASLALPAGTRVEYFLAAPDRGRLRIDAVRSEAPGPLTVVFDTYSKRVTRRFEAPVRSVAIPLPASGELMRIALQAGGRDLMLRRPAVLSPPQADGETNALEARRPNVIVYLIDTLRADHLSCYGYSKSTPHLDALASDGTLFERALAQSSWTRPATASILTGLHPRAHTANRRDDALPDSVPTLAETLGAIGYETAALVVNANVSAAFGFDRGFETFDLLLHEDGILGASGDRLVDRAIEWLDERSAKDPGVADRPFLLYLHTTDPHDPYGTTGFHGEGFGTVSFMNSLEEERVALTSDERERLVGLYDEDVAFADAQLGRFVAALEKRGLYDQALIVLLSDHGEEFEDHGRWRHGKTLYEEQLEVPLIVKWPGGAEAGRRISAIVQHIDVLPTILDYAGVPAPVPLPGRSLFRLIGTEPSREERAVLSYLLLDGREMESIVVRNRKLIRTLSYDLDVAPYQLFDLSVDRGEKASLASTERQATDFLEAYLHHLTPAPAAEAAKVTIEGDVERQLRALGYIR